MRVIRSFEDLCATRDRSRAVVTLFSGGLDSSYLLYRLHKAGFGDVRAVAVNVGGVHDAPRLAGIAGRFGASLVDVDARGKFAEEAVAPAIRAHARYLGGYPLSSSLSRPVIAGEAVAYAASIGAGIVLHTANLSQNSLPRLNHCIAAHAVYDGRYGSPYEGSVVSRARKADELAAVGLNFDDGRRLSGDENLWCREFESGPLDDPEDFSIPEDVFAWTRTASPPPAQAVALTFEDGALRAIDGAWMTLVDALALLNVLVGSYGHGRFVGLEHLDTDDKVLEVREAPAADAVMRSLRHLEVACLETRALLLKQRLEAEWAHEAVSGRWHGSTRVACDDAIRRLSLGVTGTVTLAVDSHRCLPSSIVADAPRYVRDRDAWELRAAAVLHAREGRVGDASDPAPRLIKVA